MLWDADAPAADAALAAVPLGPSHVPQMLELVEVRPPGPFAARTHELGEYYGVFEGTRLVAMAGERMEAGALREISGVCTHPDFEGRGLARRLIAKLPAAIARGQFPFQSCATTSTRAAFRAHGFRFHQRCAAVVSRI